MSDRELFLYELEGRGYIFDNMTWLGNCFEDNFLNMAYEMWCASASREGYKLVPVDPTDEIIDKCHELLIYGKNDGKKLKSIYKAMINSI